MSDERITVRRATPSDLETLRRFEQGIVAAERPYDPTIKKGEVTYYDIGALIASSDACVAIAEEGGEAIGCGFARKKASPSFIAPAVHAYAGLMFVTPEHRGRGVSNLIIEALKDWARAHGLTEMRLEVYPANASAIRAYEKTGFGPHMLEMRLSLSQE